MPAVTHDSNVSVVITLDPPPIAQVGFGNVCGIFPLATNSLNGSRVVTYASVAEAQADVTGGYLSASGLAAVTAMFSQSPAPSQVKIANRDVVGVETFTACLTAILAADPDIYAFFSSSRVDADVISFAQAVEALENKLCAIQSNNADVLTATITTIDEVNLCESCIPVYHDDDTDWCDAAYLANRLVYDPDTLSVTWTYAIVGGVDVIASLTTAQRAFIVANDFNVGLAFGGSDVVMDPGVTGTGRPIYERVSADWFGIRLKERLTALLLSYGARGEKLTITTAGQMVVKAEIQALIDQGIRAGHFVEDQSVVSAETLSTADIAARRMRFTVYVQLASSTRTLSVTVNMSRNAVV